MGTTILASLKQPPSLDDGVLVQLLQAKTIDTTNKTVTQYATPRIQGLNETK